MFRKIKLSLIGLLLSLPAFAQEVSSEYAQWTLVPQVGYTMGGLTPMPIPAEIRHIDEFTPLRGLSIGADLAYRVDKSWSLSVGLHYFDRGMKTEAQVKGYHVTVNQQGNALRGYFTGQNYSRAEQRGIALPLLAQWHATKRWSFSTGPLLEYYVDREFTGSVADGYLRVDVPTGRKVVFGPLADDTPTYDFSSDMARWGLGWQLGIDYRFAKSWSAYVNGRYVFTNSFEPKFETISMRLHPIFVTLGVAYRIGL